MTELSCAQPISDAAVDSIDSRSVRPSPVRVLMVIAPVAGTSEPPVWAQRQIASLREIGVEVATYVFRGRRSIRGLLAGGRALRRKAQEFQADVVHVHYGAAQALAAVLFSDKPVVVSFCGSDLLGNYTPSGCRTWSGWLSRLLSQLASLGCCWSIAKSEELRQSLWFARARRRCDVIPNGVDLELFRPYPQEVARMAVGWSHSDPVVLFMDRQGAWVKDPQLAHAAYMEARQAIPSLRMHILENEAPERMGLFYNAADALLLTSRHEGSNNTVKEALACNLPIVATKCGDVADRLRGVQGCHVCSRDPRELGLRISQVVGIRMRSNGRRMIQDLALERVAGLVVECYNRAAKTASGTTTTDMGEHHDRGH